MQSFNRYNALAVATICAALLAPATSVRAEQSAADAAQVSRPKYQVLRYNEDWSGLAGQDLSQTGDRWDPIKYVALSDDGSIWASFGGHVRLRMESWENFLSASTNDDTFLHSRVMVHGDFHFGDRVRVFAEGKSSHVTNRGLPGGRRAGLDVDALELQQLFVDLLIPLNDGQDVTLRVGRQELLFGKQRLVSPLPWSNNMRHWDGVSASMQAGEWTLTGFATKFVPVKKYDVNDSDSGQDFFGVYFTRFDEVMGVGTDVYWFGLDRRATRIPAGSFNAVPGNEERHTVGGRLWGTIPEQRLDWDVEAAIQVGEIGAADIFAYMIATEIGYTFDDWHWFPVRWHIGMDYASGDNKAGGDVGTFNQLFPLGHAFFGYIDAIGRQNILDISTGLTMKPTKKLLVKLTGHAFWRADDADAVYNAGGGILRAAAPGAGADEIGAELDMLVKYPFTSHLVGTFGYSHFFASTFFEQTGRSRDVDFVYLIMQYTF